MPEIGLQRDMMKPILSLKHLCCQAIVIRFWWNSQHQNFHYTIILRHRGLNCDEIDAKLLQFISALEVPKTLETDLFEIGIAMIPALNSILVPLDHVNFFTHPLDSSLVSLNPTGGIQFEETVQNILKHPQVGQESKLIMANHFCVFDPSISDNLQSYLDMTSGHSPAWKLCIRHPHLRSKPHEILTHIPKMTIWELKYTWKMLSQQDKEQLSDSLSQIVLSLRHTPGAPFCGFLLDNLIKEESHNFWKLYGSKDPVDKFCFNNQFSRFLDYLSSPFCYLGPNSTNLVMELELPDSTFAHILCAMMRRIVLHYDNVLYRYLLEIWNGRSDSFRQNFCREQVQFLNDLLRNDGHHNLHFAGQIVLLLQPFSPKLQANTNPKFIGRHLCNFFNCTEQFRPPDNYLKKFVGSEEKIALLKKNAIWFDEVRLKIFVQMRLQGISTIANKIMQWALATQEERDEYITALYRNKTFLAYSFVYSV